MKNLGSSLSALRMTTTRRMKIRSDFGFRLGHVPVRRNRPVSRWKTGRDRARSGDAAGDRVLWGGGGTGGSVRMGGRNDTRGMWTERGTRRSCCRMARPGPRGNRGGCGTTSGIVEDATLSSSSSFLPPTCCVVPSGCGGGDIRARCTAAGVYNTKCVTRLKHS